MKIAFKGGYKYLRLTGGEPTLSKTHLLNLLKLNDEEHKHIFILETNGILLGVDETFSKELAKFNNVLVRVSFKGTTPEEFSLLTGAEPTAFLYQFKAVENLINAGLKPGREVVVAAMIGFSSDENIAEFTLKIAEISEELLDIDWEYVIMYPHVEKILKKYRLTPTKSVYPGKIPDDMV